MDHDFVLIDFMGNRVLPGDTVAISRKSGSAAILQAGLITEIVPLTKSIRVHYKYIQYYSLSDRVLDKHSFFVLYPSNSGKPSDQLLKIDGVEFAINQKRFAQLLMNKSDFLKGRGKPEEPEEERDSED